MSRLCFGTYAKVLQAVMQEPSDNQAIADLLLGLLTDNEQLPKVVSRLFNFKQEVPKTIVTEASSSRVIQEAYKYFNEKIVSFLNPHNKDELLPHMTKLIKDDSSITDDKKNALLTKARESSLGEFLADTFLYAIHRPNKLPTDDAGTEISSELTPILDNIARLQDVLSLLPPRPAALEIPEEVEADELTYVTELLAAYADVEKIADLPKESLDQFPKYKNDFARRRKDYYAAETIRRASRDIFGEKDHEFNLLKDETYDGVIDVHLLDYPHGFERLNKVMAQAAAIRVDKCVLSRMPDWIGASEKKGVCHILVNDRKIKGWVVSDE